MANKRSLSIFSSFLQQLWLIEKSFRQGEVQVCGGQDWSHHGSCWCCHHHNFCHKLYCIWNWSFFIIACFEILLCLCLHWNHRYIFLSGKIVNIWIHDNNNTCRPLGLLLCLRLTNTGWRLKEMDAVVALFIQIGLKEINRNQDLLEEQQKYLVE